MRCPLPPSFNHSILSFIIPNTTTIRVLFVQSSSQLQLHTSPKLTKRHHLQIRNMQFKQVLVLALSAGAYANNVASGVSCWKSGPTVSVGNISPSIATICNYLQGSAYVPQEERSQCVQDAAGVMWNFALTVGEEKVSSIHRVTSSNVISQYIGSATTRPISSTECQNGMNKQIQCQYGGETSYSNWKYR